MYIIYFLEPFLKAFCLLLLYKWLHVYITYQRNFSEQGRVSNIIWRIFSVKGGGGTLKNAKKNPQNRGRGTPKFRHILVLLCLFLALFGPFFFLFGPYLTLLGENIFPGSGWRTFFKWWWGIPLQFRAFYRQKKLAVKTTLVLWGYASSDKNHHRWNVSIALCCMCSVFIIFAVMSMSACKPNQAIYKMLWCPNPSPMHVYLDWPYIMAFRMRTQERLRAMSLSLFTIAILTWGIKTCLLNQKLILQISALQVTSLSCCLLSFPGRSPVFCSSAHGRLWQ